MYHDGPDLEEARPLHLPAPKRFGIRRALVALAGLSGLLTFCYCLTH